jgi:hypothetical protein
MKDTDSGCTLKPQAICDRLVVGSSYSINNTSAIIIVGNMHAHREMVHAFVTLTACR